MGFVKKAACAAAGVFLLFSTMTGCAVKNPNAVSPSSSSSTSTPPSETSGSAVSASPTPAPPNIKPNPPTLSVGTIELGKVTRFTFTVVDPDGGDVRLVLAMAQTQTYGPLPSPATFNVDLTFNENREEVVTAYAIDSKEARSDSAVFKFTVSGVPTPGTVQGVTATLDSNNAATVNWTALSTPVGQQAFSYEIRRTNTATNVTDMFQAASNAISYKDATLQAGSAYTYTVRGKNANGVLGPESTPTAAITVAALVAPNIYGTQLPSGEVEFDSAADLSWDAVTSAGVTGVAVFYKKSPADASWIKYQDAAASTTKMRVKGLEVNTSYVFTLQITDGKTLSALPAAAVPPADYSGNTKICTVKTGAFVPLSGVPIAPYLENTGQPGLLNVYPYIGSMTSATTVTISTSYDGGASFTTVLADGSLSTEDKSQARFRRQINVLAGKRVWVRVIFGGKSGSRSDPSGVSFVDTTPDAMATQSTSSSSSGATTTTSSASSTTTTQPAPAPAPAPLPATPWPTLTASGGTLTVSFGYSGSVITSGIIGSSLDLGTVRQIEFRNNRTGWTFGKGILSNGKSLPSITFSGVRSGDIGNVVFVKYDGGEVWLRTSDFAVVTPVGCGFTYKTDGTVDNIKIN